MSEKPIPYVEFGPCCFCGKDIAASSVDPCVVSVETVKGLWQVWRCHAQCFKERLQAREDELFAPAHF